MTSMGRPPNLLPDLSDFMGHELPSQALSQELREHHFGAAFVASPATGGAEFAASVAGLLKTDNSQMYLPNPARLLLGPENNCNFGDLHHEEA